MQNGKIIWRTAKSLLPTYDVFDEDRYFEPAKKVEPFVFNGQKLGITICEDIWNDEDFWPERIYRRDPVRELIAQGAEIILNISASPWHDGKETTRLEMLRRVARDERIPLAQVNAVGANDELIFDGHSVALDAARRSRSRSAKDLPRTFWWLDLSSRASGQSQKSERLKSLQFSAARAADFFRAVAGHPRLRPQMRFQIGDSRLVRRH